MRNATASAFTMEQGCTSSSWNVASVLERAVKMKPNIIVILADDLGYGDVSCMNPASRICTENIDRVAAEGMIMTDCHSASALCTPSRYSLLTGRYNWRSRLKFAVLPGDSFHLIEPGRETLPSLLKKHGYRTAAVGKWHLGMDWKTNPGYEMPATYGPKYDSSLMMDGIDYSQPVKNGPNDVGFDYFYGMPASLDQPPFVHMENDCVLKPPTQMIGVRNLKRHDASMQFDVEYGPAEEGFDVRQVVPDMDNKVLELISNYADKEEPFFLYYATPAVHGPLVPTETFQGKSGLNAYADFVLQLDDTVGRIDRLLRKKGIYENTILIFTSDNGCSAVADFPALLEKGHNPSYIYRGLKGDIWEGGHRVPFTVRWPKKIRPGTCCNATVCLVDLFATFAEVTGARYRDDAGEDSVSLLPLWTEQKEAVREDLVHHSANGSYSLRRGEWKIEFCPNSGGFMRKEAVDPDQPPYQLYQMNADVGEHHNLYGFFPEIERDMLHTLARYVRTGRSTPGSPQENSPNPFWPGLDFMKEDEI